MTSADYVYQCFRDAVPSAAPVSVVDWAEHSVRLVGSAFGETFRCDKTPWVREPMECANNGTRKMTFVKPIQSAGTTVGEVAILFWLAHWSGGDVAYYWPSDSKADDRWSKATEKRLRACKQVMERTSEDRFKFVKGQIIFPHCNFAQMGVRTERNITSDSYRGIVDEELHDVAGGWEPGRLEQVYGRTTAFWNSVVFNISNASQTGDQLHQAFMAGTRQYWEVKCPGCGLYHRMRTRWEDDKPHLGGLRYNADGFRLPNDECDYNKLAPTVFYQMPCGHKVRDDITERRALSLSGRYGEPTNKAASLTERSYTLEGVAVDYIPWLDLIKQKRSALRALRRGDPEPWDIYRRERECIFADIDDRPNTQTITLNTAMKKNREGLPNRAQRYATVDYQKGSLDKGELPHYWLLIMDWDENGNSLVVCEGKVLTEADLVATVKDHGVEPLCVTIDSSWNPSAIYALCFKHGFCCIKVEGRDASGASQTFVHEDGSRHIYSEPVPLHEMLGQAPTREDPAQEPMFWHAAKFGMMERLNYVRSCKELRFEIPADVSDDFKLHFDSWEQVITRNARTNQPMPGWKQKRNDDHLYQCACYSCMMAVADGLLTLGPELPEPEPQKQ